MLLPQQCFRPPHDGLATQSARAPFISTIRHWLPFADKQLDNSYYDVPLCSQSERLARVPTDGEVGG